MLLNFKIKNYKSINELDLDLSFAEGSAPNGYREEKNHIFLESGKTRVVPCLAIFGANASGKSNVIAAMDTFSDIVVKDIEGHFFPNKLALSPLRTYFEIHFKYKNLIYKYSLEYNEVQIIKECLKVGDKEIFHIFDEENSFEQLANRSYPTKKLKDIYTTECFKRIDDRPYQKKTFLAVIANEYGGLSTYISNCYQYIRRLIISDSNNLFPITMVNEMLEEDNVNIMEQVTSLVKKLDISIKTIGIETEEYKQDDFIKKVKPWEIKNQSIEFDSKTSIVSLHKVFTTHANIAGKDVRFEASEESGGTQTLLKLIPTLVFALYRGLPVIVDELDCSLHPFVVIKLIELFKDREYNKNNAQLIFTTHTTDILENNLLRKSEVATLTKTLKKGTIIRRVSDFEGIRNLSDFRKLYLSGEIFGIPLLYI